MQTIVRVQKVTISTIADSVRIMEDQESNGKSRVDGKVYWNLENAGRPLKAVRLF